MDGSEILSKKRFIEILRQIKQVKPDMKVWKCLLRLKHENINRLEFRFEKCQL